MHRMPEGYREAVMDKDATFSIGISRGQFIDPTAKDAITSTTFTGALPFSNLSQLYNANDKGYMKFATFEKSGIPTASSYGLTAPPTKSTSSFEVGIWSSSISDMNGVFDGTLEIVFSSVHTSGLTLDFSEVWAKDFKLTFYNGTVITNTETVTDAPGKWYSPRSYAYNRISMHITRLSEPFAHMRLTEVFFGSALQISGNELVGAINFIAEYDPLKITSNIDEMNMSLLNSDGRYDEDNPVGKFGTIKSGTSYSVSITVKSKGTSYSVPVGKYYIVESKGQRTRIDLRLWDCRSILSGVNPIITFNSIDHLYLQLDNFLSSYAVSHKLSETLNTMTIPQNVSFTGDTDGLTILIFLVQSIGYDLYVDRDGDLNIKIMPIDDWGTVGAKDVFEFPTVYPYTKYDFLTIQIGNISKDYDLRTSPETYPSVVTISNPFIITEVAADALAARIIPKMHYVNAKSFKWRGDPAEDAGDIIRCNTRMSASGAELKKMIVISKEWIYDGSFRMINSGVSE